MTDEEQRQAILDGRYTISPEGPEWPGLWNVVVEALDMNAWDVAFYGKKEECEEYVRAVIVEQGQQ